MAEKTEQELAEERQVEALSAKVQIASAYRQMYQSAGFQDLKKELEGRIADLKNKWLTADEAEGAKIRLRGQIYNEIFELVKSKILTGDMAGKTIDQLRDNRAE